MRWDVWGLPCNGVRGVVRYLFRMMTSAVTRAEAAAHAARVPGMAVTTKKVRAHRCVGKTGGRRGQQGPTGRGRKARISARRVSQGRPCRGWRLPSQWCGAGCQCAVVPGRPEPFSRGTAWLRGNLWGNPRRTSQGVSRRQGRRCEGTPHASDGCAASGRPGRCRPRPG